MDTQKTLNKINNKKLDPVFEAKLIAIRRQTASEDLIKEMNKKFPLTDLPHVESEQGIMEFIPMNIFKNYLQTQETMLRTGIYIAIDWDKMEYFAMDLRLGKEYRYVEKKSKKK